MSMSSCSAHRNTSLLLVALCFGLLHASPVLAQWSDQDIGAVGLAGSAAQSGGVWTVRGAGTAAVWGTADAFHFVYQPLVGDGQITARVDSLQNTTAYAKAGVMLRDGVDPGAANVVLDIRPTGDLEFMQRSTAGGETTFYATATTPAPYWVRLTRSGSVITALVSPDGAVWTTVGTTSASLPDTIDAGIVITSNDSSQLNTATFDSVTVVPSVWTHQDIGAVGLTGSASQNAGVWTVQGAGTAAIWGTADAFQFVYEPMSGDGQVTARVSSLQNTTPYAKAGVMLRDGLDPGAAHVVLDIRPTGDLEFMQRVTAGAQTTYYNTATTPPPYWVRLARSGSTVTALISSDGATWTTVGTTTASFSTTIEAGIVVTSNDSGQLNTATFDGVSVLTTPWTNQDVGTVGLTGNASSNAGTFTVAGAGATGTWGTADTFQFVFGALTGDGEIRARITSAQNTNAYAKVGVMIRDGLDASAAHVILDVKPDGSVEFMQRATAGGATSVIHWLDAGAAPLPYWLRLQRTGSMVAALVSFDGVTWSSVLGSATVSMSTNTLAGLVATSIDANHVDTATIDQVHLGSMPTPIITNLNPASGPFGQAVTISGSHFGSTQANSLIMFNGTPAPVTSWTDGSITTTVPTAATSGPVVATVAGQASNGVTFTVVMPPTISSLTPSSGGTGQTVSIVGAYFGATQGASSVTLNGTTAAATSWSDTWIVTTVPNGATTGPVVVTVNGQASNAVAFTVLQMPTITAVTPSSATVGQSVIVTGQNFGDTQGTSTVTFNGTAATITAWTATAIVASVPANATSGSIVVTVGGNSSSGSPFTIVPVSPTAGCSAQSGTLIYRQNWALGQAPSAMRPNFYLNTTWGGPDPVDSLYPEIAASEAIRVLTGVGPSGENVLDLNPAGGEDYGDAGVAFGGFGPIPDAGHNWWDATTGCVSVQYLWNTTAWNTTDYDPLIVLTTNLLDSLGLEVDASINYPTRADGTFVLQYPVYDPSTEEITFSTLDNASFTRAATENQWQTFTIRWKTGTCSDEWCDSVAPDGWLEVSWNGTVIYQLTNIALCLNPNGGDTPTGQPNLLKMIYLGYDGLFGATTNLIVTTGDRRPLFQVEPTMNGEPIGQDPDPSAMRTMCLNPTQWPTGWDRLDVFGNAVQFFNKWISEDAGEVAQCFSNLHAANKKLAVAAGALKKDICASAQSCWDTEVATLRTMRDLGGTPDYLEIDEPLTTGGLSDNSYVVSQTAEWIRLARVEFPGIDIILQESYPTQSAATLATFFGNVNDQAIQLTGRGFQFVHLDHDWTSPDSNMLDVLTIENSVHVRGIGFGVIFWSAGAGGRPWYNGVMYQAALYNTWRRGGIRPDLYAVIDWRGFPTNMFPEAANESDSFAYSVRDFSNTYLPFPNAAFGLRSGDTMVPNDFRVSVDGRFRLEYQADGNLVVTMGDAVIWNAQTSSSSPQAAYMRSDGMFVLLDSSGVYWSRGESGTAGSFLVMQSDGNVVVYTPGGRATWASGSNYF